MQLGFAPHWGQRDILFMQKVLCPLPMAVGAGIFLPAASFLGYLLGVDGLVESAGPRFKKSLNNRANLVFGLASNACVIQRKQLTFRPTSGALANLYGWGRQTTFDKVVPGAGGNAGDRRTFGLANDSMILHL